MNRILFALLLTAALGAAPYAAAVAQEGKAKPVNADRLQGMKAALADVEKGTMKLKAVPPPAPPWEADYLKLVKEECGVEIVYVDDKESSDTKLRARMDGYNAVILLEIEHRHGKGTLERLGKRAMDEHQKAESPTDSYVQALTVSPLAPRKVRASSRSAKGDQIGASVPVLRRP